MIRFGATLTYGASVIAAIVAFLLIFPAMLFGDAPGSGSVIVTLVLCALGSVGATILSGKAITQRNPYFLASALFTLALLGILIWGTLVA